MTLKQLRVLAAKKNQTIQITLGRNVGVAKALYGIYDRSSKYGETVLYMVNKEALIAYYS